MAFVNILGYSAGAVTALTFLPQVIKTWKERSAKDISLLMFIIAATNEVMWIGYGILKTDWVIILTNAIVLVLSLTMIYLKLRFKYMTTINTIIFDLGNVLVDWNPMHVYHDYFDSEEKRNYFFENICTADWNEKQDEGKSIVVATQELVERFPDWEQPIRDFYGRWTEMLKGPIYETVEIFRQLKDSGRFKIYALTNWQAGLFDIALVRYNFLHWFDGRVVSGEEKTRKPFPEFYRRLFDRYQVNPSEALFIDDSLRNIKAAKELGLKTIHFKSSQQLRNELTSLGLM